MAAIHNDEFRRDAVRIALASGLARRQVASVSGTRHSTLGKRVRMFSDVAKAPAQGAELLVLPPFHRTLRRLWFELR